MPVDTRPDNIDFQIPEVDLGDTFNTWRDITNLSVYKLNKFKLYEGLSSDSVAVNVSAGGTAQIRLQENITTGVSFMAQVVFGDGVTFNGPVTFNAPTFTVNANTVTIDDYNLVLGDTAAASDANITQAGGGGLFINRGSGRTASWVWNPERIHGLTGIWLPDAHIGFTGGVAGIYPHQGTTLDIHGTGIQLDGGTTTDHGLLVSMSSSGVGGITTNRRIDFLRYSPSGSTAFMQVFNGVTYTNAGLSAETRPYVSIPNGVNKKTIRQSGHSFLVGIPVTLGPDGRYYAAKADTPDNAEVVGVVSAVDNEFFEITFLGEVFGIGSNITDDNTALITGSVYYLSPYYAGKLTGSQPTQQNTVHKAVLLATSATSGVVMPWTGGVLTEPLNLAEASSTSVRINQLNQFRLGDIVRFKVGSTSLSYNYSSGGSTSGTYSNGIFVRAQANSTAEAEVAGIVVSTEAVAGTGVNRAFNLMMDGFFEFVSGVSAVNGGANTAFTAGKVYFLNSDCAGTTGSFEKASAACYNDAPPTTPGRVRKPMLFTIAPTKGYLFSYRGDVTGLPGISANTPLEDLLIQNLGSCGAAEDLRFGVRNASGSAGGTRVMTFDGTTAGNIRIGPSSFTSTSVGAGATLSVLGSIYAGDYAATNGAVIIASRYSAAYPDTLNVFGTEYSSGNSVIGYGLRGKTTGAGYLLTTTAPTHRCVLEVGQQVSRPGLVFAGWSGGSTTGAMFGEAPTTDYFTVIGGQGSTSRTGVFITGSDSPALAVGSLSTSTVDANIHVRVDQPVLNIENTNSVANSRSTLRFGHTQSSSQIPMGEIYTTLQNGGGAGARAGDMHFATSYVGVLSPHLSIVSTGQVGVGTTAPAAPFHVLEPFSAQTNWGSANRGILLISGGTAGGVQLQMGITTGTTGAWIEGWTPTLGVAPLTLQPSGGETRVIGQLTTSDIVAQRNTTTSIRVINTANTGYAQVVLRNDGLISSGIWHNASTQTGYGGPNSFNVGNVHGSTMGFVTNNTLRMIMVGSNVGINTTTPTVPLDVNGTIRGTNIDINSALGQGVTIGPSTWTTGVRYASTVYSDYTATNYRPRVVQIGKMVVITGLVLTSSAVAAGSVAIRGLPPPANHNLFTGLGPGGTTVYRFDIDTSGNLIISPAIPAAATWWSINCVYTTA